MNKVVFKPLVYQDLIVEILVLIIFWLLHLNIVIISVSMILILYELYHFLHSYNDIIVVTEDTIKLMNLYEANQNNKIKKIELKKGVVTNIRIEKGFRSRFLTITTRKDTFVKDISDYCHFSSRKFRTALTQSGYKLT